MSTINRLSINALRKLEEIGSYDTEKYRYVIDRSNGECYRINKKLLGTAEALNPENWVEQ